MPYTRIVSSVFAIVVLLLCLGITARAQSQQAVPCPTPEPAPLTTRQQRRLIRHNEAGALRTLINLHSAEATYQATTGNGDYGTLAQLRKEGLIDSVLAEGHRFGYLFYVRREKHSSESPQASLELVAVPRTHGKTGRRSFYMDQSGEIHAADKKGAEASPGDYLLVIDP